MKESDFFQDLQHFTIFTFQVLLFSSISLLALNYNKLLVTPELWLEHPKI